MKQIVVISGKGGTGKTTVTSSLAYLSKDANIADCDVEAPNLNLMFDNEIKDKKLYTGGEVAVLDSNKCIQCGKCLDICRFNAIDKINEEIHLENIKCEGCGACEYICPVLSKASTMNKE